MNLAAHAVRRDRKGPAECEGCGTDTDAAADAMHLRQLWGLWAHGEMIGFPSLEALSQCDMPHGTEYPILHLSDRMCQMQVHELDVESCADPTACVAFQM